MTALYLHEYAPAGSRLPRPRPRRRPEPRRRALRRLRPLRPRLLRPLHRRAPGQAWPAASIRFGQPGILWASLTLAVLTLPGRHRRDRGGAPRRPGRPADRQPGAGRHQVADPLANRPARRASRHPHGRHPGGLARCRRGRAHPPDGRRLLPPRAAQDARPRSSCTSATTPTSWRPSRRTSTPRRPLLYGTVLVLLVFTFALNLVAIMIRARTRSATPGARSTPKHDRAAPGQNEDLGAKDLTITLRREARREGR
jgi:phosphate transport system permease protein